MKDHIDHERCSELLGGYVAGELSGQDRSAVESHLAACSECDQERVALAALASGEEDLLADEERRVLHERVEAALASPGGDVIGIETGRRRRARWGQMVGIAASIVLLVAGLFYVGVEGLGGRDGDDAAVGGDAPTQEDAGAGGKAGPVGEDRARLEAGEADAGAQEESAAPTSLSAGAPGPVFDDAAGKVTERTLARLGRRGSPFASYAATYTVSDALARRDALLDDLAALAPNSAIGDDVRACSERVFSGGVDAILPAYGALGRFKREEVLILGFAWSDRSNGPLFRWMFWAWPRGDCDGLNSLYQTGRIKR